MPTRAARLQIISLCSNSVAALAKAGVALGGSSAGGAGGTELSESLAVGWQSGEVAGNTVGLNRQGQGPLATCIPRKKLLADSLPPLLGIWAGWQAQSLEWAHPGAGMQHVICLRMSL